MHNANYQVQPNSDFFIENYQWATPFSSFLPGVAGVRGRPLWAFYCNRGQAMASFGLRDKNGSVLEFHPAVKAYSLVGTHGFRTCLRIDGTQYEAFAQHAPDSEFRQTMTVRPHEIAIAESNPTLGLSVDVCYYTLPEDQAAALIREVCITNDSHREMTIELLDGLPFVVPAFVKNGSIKDVANTKCGTVDVRGIDEGIVYTRSSVKSSDAVKIESVEAGNFCIGIGPDRQRLNVIGDPKIVFGDGGSFTCPHLFHTGAMDLAAQRTCNFMPCAFVHDSFTLQPGQHRRFHVLMGQAPNYPAVQALAERAANAEFFTRARSRNEAVINEIQNYLLTVSGSNEFDSYSRYTFMDNALRGGVPVTVGDKAVHVYFRKHGDMERDYNEFLLSPEPYSQGNGAFRDISQNRRLDPIYNPSVGADNIRTFFDAVQLDGNNPLLYGGAAFTLDETLKDLHKVFTVGDLYSWAQENGKDADAFVSSTLPRCRQVERWTTGGGYWVDHWTYSLDHLETFAGLFPERVEGVMFDSNDYCYFDNPDLIRPRAARYAIDPDSGAVRQFKSLETRESKVQAIAARSEEANSVRTASGRIYRTSLAEKILCLIATRFAMLDPDGLGVEMLGNRPGWNDAMNGLPGLLGSSVSETAELLRLTRWMLACCRESRRSVTIASELAELMQMESDWNSRHTALERYLEQTADVLSGEQQNLPSKAVLAFLEQTAETVADSIRRARNDNGLYHTFFYYDVSDYDEVDGAIVPKAFARRALPAFLEGQVRVMKVLPAEERRALYDAVRNSPLYDRKLGMYRLNESLAEMPRAIGRAGIFPPGWLENESIWMHMEYKYLLEVLKADLCGEFFTDMKSCLVPFLDPQVYGRSPLEHSSFICSSAHPDETRHGRGFYARLSGATIEFLSIHAAMTGFDRAFRLEDGQLRLRFQPRLPAWLFTQEERVVTWTSNGLERSETIPANAFAALFLGKVLVVYHNPKRLDIFEDKHVESYVLNGRTYNELGPDLAKEVRDGEFDRIDVNLK